MTPSRFKSFKTLKFYSDVVISEDKLSADYELKVEAIAKDGGNSSEPVTVVKKYPVNKVFDSKGYFHIRKASDLIIDDFFEALLKEVKQRV